MGNAINKSISKYINKYTQESETMYNSSPAPIIQSENYVQRQFRPKYTRKIAQLFTRLKSRFSKMLLIKKYSFCMQFEENKKA